ncbi:MULTISPECIES: ABC transporter ATP-binding protein [Lysinibacillus]|uniref:ABC transporter ATP-binding protein n=1 Tax=Lysinibacillus TaxID=400634 RepID=UPI0021A90112|nr:ABC transporter ATP-binding protein [Lysinibacillus capsici]MCT1540631.1 ABC transporter ATP-binding protein [Lysinibacillus capsici]MCT1571869.1 ABC transporter ATP-binding protein [Lysinibacillus capsici]MCT1648973.1 ABC transporter ATP-binding protein [Lysinibacillus capsici]MCT1727299.1 ABC transporter ATP-binding protein [Lysinibacillus capsici]MCT1784866.1 ABC transporter ATP-binding protein [Lysinibacillus capsici]
MLEIRDLSITLQTAQGPKKVVQHVDFQIPTGTTLGIVGESGSGKTMLCYAILQLFRESRNYEGDILLEGRSLMEMDEQQLRGLRGNDVACILQNPLAMFNPIITIGEHMIETVQAHRSLSKKQALHIATEQLAFFQLTDSRLLKKYPHELSGGMLQRVMIAMAMSLRPKLLLADEPTTALDTMTQLKVLEELSHCQQQYQTTMLIVSHDLGVIARMADQIVVMRRGKIMEYGPAERILQNPVHSYTKALVAAKRKDDQLEKLVDSWSGDTNGILYELDTNYWVRQEEIRC